MVLILSRLICTFGAALFTRFISRFIKVADPNPGWKMPLISGWAGMRGVVSLAAALSIPLLASKGEAFPYRNLILFITFIVILVTLVFQGLTLPWLIRKVDLTDQFKGLSEEQQDLLIQKKITQSSIQFLQKKYENESLENDYFVNLSERLAIDLRMFEQEPPAGSFTAINEKTAYGKLYLELLQHQRQLLNGLNRHEEFDEDLIRKYLSLIDVEEFKVRGKIPQEIISVIENS